MCLQAAAATAVAAAWLTLLLFIAQFLLAIAAHSCILMSMAHILFALLRPTPCLS